MCQMVGEVMYTSLHMGVQNFNQCKEVIIVATDTLMPSSTLETDTLKR